MLTWHSGTEQQQLEGDKYHSVSQWQCHLCIFFFFCKKNNYHHCCFPSSLIQTDFRDRPAVWNRRYTSSCCIMLCWIGLCGWF